jgi:hypothetical protein
MLSDTAVARLRSGPVRQGFANVGPTLWQWRRRRTVPEDIRKLVHYDSQNLVARSLNENAYDHNPGFRRFLEQSGLPFRAHTVFRKADLDDRQELYGQLADYIWNPVRLDEAATSSRSSY